MAFSAAECYAPPSVLGRRLRVRRGVSLRMLEMHRSPLD
jgi:hypothetical protein